MKKCIKIVLTLILAAVMLLSAGVCAHALPAPMRIGDVDGDSSVTVLDATHIQRWLADLEDMLMADDWPQKLQEYIGDIDGSGSCDILDATYIQRYLADLIDKKDALRYTWAYYIGPTRFYANYNSGKAMVGKPVTFTAEIPGYNDAPIDDITNEPAVPPVEEPYTFEFRINGEVVQERSEKNTLTYTFSEAGDYKIEAVFYNALDCTHVNDLSHTARLAYNLNGYYRVVKPYDLSSQPVIVYAGFPDDNEENFGYGPLAVRAEGGSGGYQYCYTLRDGDFIADSNWKKVSYYDEERGVRYDTYTTGWIDSDTVEMPQSESRSPAGIVTVVARDSSGVCSEVQEVYYCKETLEG